MTARTPAELADVAAEGIRSLNHALYAGFTYPGDAYSTVGELSRLASMLPQALTMIRGAVEKLEQDSALQSDRDTLADDLARTYDGLQQAASNAQALYESIRQAHAGLSHIGLQDGAS
jgi:hypothetical protein